MTDGEFETAYALRSGVSVRGLHYQGRYAEPCDCGDGMCEGWAMGHQQEDAIIEDQLRGRPPSLRNGDCGYGVVPEEWHHGVAGPPMTDTPADRCER